MPNPPDWSELSAVMQGDPAARYRLGVVEVVESLHLYRPLARIAPVGDEAPPAELVRHRRRALRARVVTENRLRTLALALEQIRRLGADAPVGWVEATQHKTVLERHLRLAWALEPPEPGQDPTAWAQAAARRA